MKTKKRHISTKKMLIVGTIAGIILLASLLYLYHNHWKGVYFVDDVPTSLVGVGMIILISLTICMVSALGTILLISCFPQKSESKKQIKNLPNDSENVDIKESDV